MSLFKKEGKDTVEQLAVYISKNYLIREEAKVKLGMGKQDEVKNIHSIFSVWEVNQMKDKKMLTFTENNKSVYKINEKVSLELKVKNIRNVSLKLFGVNLEKHYLENSREVDEEMNLKFLVAVNERKEEYPFNDPFQEHKVTIDIPELQDQLGMFIVEIEGEGVTSRAIIRKGTIILKNKVTPTGHQLTFFDQNGQQI